MEEKLGIDREQLAMSETLDNLEVDSLGLVELGVAVKREFGVKLDFGRIDLDSTVGDIVDFLDNRVSG
jgi:acyl carrier protein